MKDLSILIPARNEMFLAKTVEDILSNIEADTEVIVILDGQWSDPPLKQHDRLKVIFLPESIGQRAATNMACRLSKAKYVMKCDAHCAFDKGFDRKMIAEMSDDWTMVPTMRNLHAFDWVCPDGHRRYQSPSGPCKECGKPVARDVVWIPKTKPQSNSYCFDPDPHFQYFNEFTKRPEYQKQGDLSESMSIQGSCFMLTREKYWELGICDESFGSWGSQGIEVACKTWLSGGKVIINHKTWYAHMFRTQGGDFSFPYPQSEHKVQAAKKHARNLFFENKWEKARHPISWLVEKFWPVKGWTEESLAKLKAQESGAKPAKNLTAGIVYFTDNVLDEGIMNKCREQLKKSGLPIVSVSLKPIDFGHNIVVNEERGILTMFKQILAGLEKLDTDAVFLCEHDVLYHPSHFSFKPYAKDLYYYNTNSWLLRASDGHALYYDCKKLGQLCGDRKLLIDHFRKRIAIVEKNGFNRRMGFEPGTHKRPERVDDLKCELWRSDAPNVDIKHDKNLTGTRWNQSEFRDKRNCQNWQEAEEIPGWGKGKSVI